MKHRTLWTGVALAGMLLLAVAGWRWRGTAVNTVTVQATPLIRTLQFSGRVSAVSRVDIGSTLTGRVARVSVREGQSVAAGQVLIELETAEAQAALAQAQAAEQQAHARLTGLRSTGRRSVLAAQAQAQATLQAAQAELQRTQALIEQGFVSGSRLTEAQRVMDVAQAQYANASAQTQANQDKGTDIEQAQAQLAVAQAATAAALARLAQCELRAPTAAQVLVRQVEPGQIVQPGKALLSLALQGPIQLKAPVDERFLEQLAVGQPATVVADAFANQRMSATVQSIAPAVDAQRGAIELKLGLTGPTPDFLRDDMSLSIEVETARRDKARVLPSSVLRGAAGASPTVWVVRDGRLVAQAVQLGLRTLDAVEILSGVADGEPVVLGAAPALGARVRPSTVAPPQALPRSPGNAADAGSALSDAMGR